VFRTLTPIGEAAARRMLSRQARVMFVTQLRDSLKLLNSPVICWTLYQLQSLRAAIRFCLAAVRRHPHGGSRRLRYFLWRQYPEWNPNRSVRFLPVCHHPDGKPQRHRSHGSDPG
jgi:hypothetical protein